MIIRHTRSRRAFTLVELILATAVFLLMAAILFGVLGGVNRNWQQAQGQIKTRQSGRAILDYISREMEAAALPANRGMIYLAANSSPQSTDLGLQFVENPTQISSNSYLNPHAIFWQAPIATDTSQSAMAEVGYFVRWDTNNPGNPRAMLCRFFVNPSDTNYLIYSNAASWTPSAWLSDTILDAAAPGVKDQNNPGNSYRGWFADNVIGIWVRCLSPQGNTITNTALNTALTNYAYDSRKGFSYVASSESKTNTVTKSGYTSAGTTNQILASLPASVEVALVILDSRAAARLTQKPTYPATPPTATSFWSDINTFVTNLPPSVRGGARIYSGRITLKNAR